MIAGNLLIAYHGCDATTRDDLVTGAIPCLAQSRNRYDWLGPGAYFFEGDDRRALKFAMFNSSLDGNTRRAIDFKEGDAIDAKALKGLIRAAMALNASK